MLLILLLLQGLYLANAGDARRQCQRLAIPEKFLAGKNSTYNPAAVWQEGLGWWAFANHDVCHFSNCGSDSRNTQPMGMYLGSGLGPDAGLAKVTASIWKVTMLQEAWQGSCNYTTDHADACIPGKVEYVIITEDYRPFIHEDNMWVALTVHPHPKKHHLDAGHRPVQAVAQANFDQKELKITHVFYRTVNANNVNNGVALVDNWEKNWGFFEYNGRTYILYSVMPCVIVLEFQPHNPVFGYRYVQGRCYTKDDGVRLKAMWKSKHPAFDARLSGHPHMWQGTLYAMAHVVLKPSNASFADVKYYSHYLLKVDPTTWTVTHMSETPVITSLDYNVSGPFKGALVIGSFHINQEGSTQLLRMLFGEGDKYSCKDAMPLADIVWRELDADNWASPVPATDMFLNYRDVHVARHS